MGDETQYRSAWLPERIMKQVIAVRESNATRVGAWAVEADRVLIEIEAACRPLVERGNRASRVATKK
jgi:hypothetical protein